MKLTAKGLILQKFNTDKTVCQALNKKRIRRMQKTLISSITLFCLAVLFGLIFQPQLMGWIVAISIAALISVLMVLYICLSKRAVLIGEIESVNHDYRLEGDKGTGGFERAHSNIREKHNLIVTIKDYDHSEKFYSFVCPPQYERVLNLGDTVFYHPCFKYPATLSNKSKCICINCGAMQSSQNETCFECKTTLFNINTVNE